MSGRACMPARCTSKERGQMTVELCIVIPVVLIVAVIVVNALTFFEVCAEFDRVGRNAVRVVAASPAHGQTQEQLAAAVKNEVTDRLGDTASDVEVVCQQVDGCMNYELTVKFAPTLFGANMRQEIFGVSLPNLSHSTELTVQQYSPGMSF